MNDLEISSSHLERLCRELTSIETVQQLYILTEQASVRDRIISFAAATTKIRASARLGLEQLFNQLLRPKLRNLIPDVYKDVSYALDEEGYSTAEYKDIVRKRFIKSWDSFMDGYSVCFFPLALIYHLMFPGYVHG